MKHWLTYMRTKYLVDFIVTKDKYGDWCVPPEAKELIYSRDSSRNTDGKLIATAYYYKILSLMQRFAEMLKKTEDVREFAALNLKIKDAFNAKFFDEKSQRYNNNSVTANLLPLYFGMVPDSSSEEVFGNIVEKITRNRIVTFPQALLVHNG